MTTTAKRTIKNVIDNADLNELPAALRQAQLGSVLTRIREVITIASATTLNLETSSAAKKGALLVEGIRVVAGTATGVRNPAPSGSTPTTTIATVSDNGKILTFEAVVTQVEVTWIPLPAVDLAGIWADPNA